MILTAWAHKSSDQKSIDLPMWVAPQNSVIDLSDGKSH